MEKIKDSELIINADGSIFHLNLKPEHIGDTILLLGDPGRVAEVSKYFDEITIKVQNREFCTHTGTLRGKKITALSTGIGTDNIDIVINELDALVNIDLASRKVKEQLNSLTIVRIGTSGAIQTHIPIDTILVSEYALGLDALMLYYGYSNTAREQELVEALNTQVPELKKLNLYFTSAGKSLLDRIGKGLQKGITVTAPGFYAPQGRNLRYSSRITDLIGKLNQFNYENQQITNLEMETAGIYALASILGHQALSVNAILASRVKLEFSKNPQKVVDNAIKLVLERI